jgi:anti-sigma factor RsiW
VDITTELADAHARSVLSSQALEVASSDHHTVKPWLSGHLPFSPPVPATLGIDDELLGGRVDVINRQPVAALVYRHGQHRVDVFVWPSASMPGTPTVRPTTDGYGLAEAAAGEFRAVFVSDMSPAEMARFVDAWRAASAPR